MRSIDKILSSTGYVKILVYIKDDAAWEKLKKEVHTELEGITVGPDSCLIADDNNVVIGGVQREK